MPLFELSVSVVASGCSIRTNLHYLFKGCANLSSSLCHCTSSCHFQRQSRGTNSIGARLLLQCLSTKWTTSRTPTSLTATTCGLILPGAQRAGIRATETAKAKTRLPDQEKGTRIQWLKCWRTMPKTRWCRVGSSVLCALKYAY